MRLCRRCDLTINCRVNDSTANSSSPAKPGRRTWSYVARLVHDHPQVKQLRLDRDARTLTLGFYDAPSDELLESIKLDVARGFSGEWDVAIRKDGSESLLHLHYIDGHTTEVHRPHPPNEPPVIWKRVALPVWRNRPFPRPVSLDYRIMLTLAGLCGLTTLAGFLLRYGGANNALISGCFAVAYLCGGWFATQDVWQGLKHGKIDIQFLMIAVAVGALFVNAALEGATLLFLFSLSNALEQFANHRTRRSIESLLQIAPSKHCGGSTATGRKFPSKRSDLAMNSWSNRASYFPWTASLLQERLPLMSRP